MMSEPPVGEQRIGLGAAPPAPAARPISRVRLWGVTAAVVGGFAAADLLANQLFHERDSRFLRFVLAGAFIAQVNLIAAWAVFGRWNVVVRLPAAAVLGMAMWCVLVLGEWPYAIYGPDDLLLCMILVAGVFVGNFRCGPPSWSSAGD